VSGGIAITGVGAVSAVGVDVPALTAALLEGRCGIAPLTLFPYQGRSALAAQVPEGVAVPGTLPAVTARRLSRPDRFALAAASEACRDAGLDGALRHDAALALGATTGGMFESEEAYRQRQTGEAGRFRLSRLLGTSITTMSLPGGRYNRRILTACQDAGYEQVFTSIPRAEPDPTAPTIGRLNIRGDMSIEWVTQLFQPGSTVLSGLERQYQRKAAAKALQKTSGSFSFAYPSTTLQIPASPTRM